MDSKFYIFFPLFLYCFSPQYALAQESTEAHKQVAVLIRDCCPFNEEKFHRLLEIELETQNLEIVRCSSQEHCEIITNSTLLPLLEIEFSSCTTEATSVSATLHVALSNMEVTYDLEDVAPSARVRTLILALVEHIRTNLPQLLFQANSTDRTEQIETDQTDTSLSEPEDQASLAERNTSDADDSQQIKRMTWSFSPQFTIRFLLPDTIFYGIDVAFDFRWTKFPYFFFQVGTSYVYHNIEHELGTINLFMVTGHMTVGYERSIGPMSIVFGPCFDIGLVDASVSSVKEGVSILNGQDVLVVVGAKLLLSLSIRPRLKAFISTKLSYIVYGIEYSNHEESIISLKNLFLDFFGLGISISF